MYAYIQSRFYRAPEIILGIPYSYPIDMWSLGCILLELYYGYPIFPGQTEQEQLAMIMEMRGVPPINLLQEASRVEMFFDQNGAPKVIKDNEGKPIVPNSMTLGQYVEAEDRNFMKFLDACLHWDPDLRMTPEEGLRHDWILEGVPEDVQRSLNI